MLAARLPKHSPATSLKSIKRQNLVCVLELKG